MKSKVKKFSKYLNTKKMYIVFFVIIPAFFVLSLINVVNSPKDELAGMLQLENAKNNRSLSEFKSDGCSGNISKNWKASIISLSKIFPQFSERYQEAQNIPFEYACVKHDKQYHLGEGGYVARLKADNALRNEIITYAITNVAQIKNRTNLKTDEEAIFLYETIAEAVYLGVRSGGKPCTKMPYSWGFGYDDGSCE